MTQSQNSKTQFIKDLKPGMQADSIFLIIKKIIKKKKNGEDYCIISLQDRTGTVDGVIWTDVFSSTGPFGEGDFGFIKGEITDYRGTLQLTVSSLTKISSEKEKIISIADYVKTTGKNIDKMLNELRIYIDKIENEYLKELLRSFFEDEKFVDRFCKATAAVQYHHAYIGGLLEHTLAMVKISDSIVDIYSDIKAINKDLVITGIILHDIGKMDEYTTEKNGALIKITDEGKLLGHITIGYGIVLKKIEAIKKFPCQLKDRLLHIILSHHGHKEFGSPKRPKTLEAFLVHHIDYLDADIGGFANILESKSSDSGWSEYLRNFERSILLKELNIEETFDSEEENDSEPDKLF